MSARSCCTRWVSRRNSRPTAATGRSGPDRGCSRGRSSSVTTSRTRRAAAQRSPSRRIAVRGWARSRTRGLLLGRISRRHGAFNADWLDAGALRSGAVRAGEVWRAVTALTLHLDVGHMLSNLGFGTVFGLLAGQLLGPGVAWASVLAAAASANLLNAWLQPEVHSSVGASTAVFATLGLLAAYAWRRRSGETGAVPTAGRRSLPASSCSRSLGSGARTRMCSRT